MQARSISREIALLILGQIKSNQVKNIGDVSVDDLLLLGLETLINHWREQLDECAIQIESANQKLLDSELADVDINTNPMVRNLLTISLQNSQDVLNKLSDISEITRLVTLSNQDLIRNEAIQRVNFVIKDFQGINASLDNVMEGWRLKRLPRIDQDILRLAYVDIYKLMTPISVACNEAVNLANRYSDDQGRKMINGILRRLQSNASSKTA